MIEKTIDHHEIMKKIDQGSEEEGTTRILFHMDYCCEIVIEL